MRRQNSIAPDSLIPMHKLVLIFTILLSLTPSVFAQGYAAGAWPNSAWERGLPRPQWVMAIPARRTTDGNLVIWDRRDEWSRAWRVPRIIDGMRIVTLMGDTQDSRSITPAAIDGMLVDEMQVVLEKYGAPALALIVNDGQNIAIAGYVKGWQASWTAISAEADVQESRERSIEAIGRLFNGAGVQNFTQPTTAIEIIAYRQNQYTGGVDYRLSIQGKGAAAAVDILAGMQNGNLVEATRDRDGFVVTIERFPGAPSLENDLQTYGLVP